MNNIINQLFEIDKKSAEQNIDVFDRNLKRIFHELEEMGYKIINPLGNIYDERDASIEANILNSQASRISKVLKPVIYKSENGSFALIQKGVALCLFPF